MTAISPIYRHGPPGPDPDPHGTNARIEIYRRRAWIEQGSVTVRPDELPPKLGAALRAWATHQWGPRAGDVFRR